MLKEKCYIIARTVNEDDYISGWQEEQGIKIGSTVFWPADRDYFETNKLGEAKIWANKTLAERKLKKEYNDDPTARVVEIELVANI